MHFFRKNTYTAWAGPASCDCAHAHCLNFEADEGQGRIWRTLAAGERAREEEPEAEAPRPSKRKRAADEEAAAGGSQGHDSQSSSGEYLSLCSLCVGWPSHVAKRCFILQPPILMWRAY